MCKWGVKTPPAPFFVKISPAFNLLLLSGKEKRIK